jgi:hypothetical protein
MFTVMKKFIPLLLAVLVLVITGCGAAKRARAEKARKLHAVKIEDFISFIGVTKGDTYEKAVELWGEPGREDLNEGSKVKFATMYYYGKYDEKLFNLTYDKRDYTLNYIKVSGNKELNYDNAFTFFKQRNVQDIKVQFLGMHRDSITSVFGEPTRTMTSDLIYEIKGMTVTFVCYAFAENRCDEIYVFWNYNYKPEE